MANGDQILIQINVQECVFFIKLRTFGFVFIALDNSVVHMCLYVAVDQIMLLPSNQMECIIRAQCSLMACVYLLRKSLFGFLPRCMDLRPQSYPPPPFFWSQGLCVSVCVSVCMQLFFSELIYFLFCLCSFLGRGASEMQKRSLLRSNRRVCWS